ncbi:glycosyltransferase family 25 protein [Methylomonas sp. MO1]|uniref:glycosyltransferase family 25 protein n=1 Tax=unclassified Methylomonas TaxID=2608980 RepID=UPI00047A91B1|nr:MULTISPECIES: glycosyltransferase family 25 protein [unclassified Methylomonas]MDT4289953.1 glycosyltransferase family 25 protein [Methylomonas sp. MO1]
MMLSPSLDRILVLNVKKFAQRRIFMEQQLRKFGLSAEFIFDWDIEDLTDSVMAEFFRDNQLTAGQQSCALKHVAALQKIADAGGQGYSLVLEDDAVFGKDIKLGLERAIAQSARFPGDKVIYIGSGGNFFTPKSQREPGQYLYLGHRGRFADSYLIDASTARRRLDWIKAHKIAEPIDNQFEKIDKQLGIQMIWLEDPVIEQGSKNGLFKSALEADPPTWLKGLFFRWEKLKRKHIYQLWR